MLLLLQVAERGGMDEVLVDVTAEAQTRIARGAAETRWRAHVHTSKVRHNQLVEVALFQDIGWASTRDVLP